MNLGRVETRIPALTGTVADDTECLADETRMRLHS